MTTTEATSTRNPGYLDLLGSGVLKDRVQLACQHLEQCDLCARYCRVNRLKTTEGAICQTGEQALVYSFGAHYGEEEPISGWMGSGAIFFGRCNPHCVFCQNWEISQTGAGRSATPDQIALIMLALQKRGCHNINLVSPSHVVAQIVSAIFIAAQHGLHIPLVYNTGGYDSLEALQLLDGIIDIYMPDMKYGTSTASRRLASSSWAASTSCRAYRTTPISIARQFGRCTGRWVTLYSTATASQFEACSCAISSCPAMRPAATRSLTSLPKTSHRSPMLI